MLVVQAPNKLITFKCGPKCIKIFSSEARDRRAVVGSKDDLTILTATVLIKLSSRL